MELEQLKYPVGDFRFPKEFGEKDIEEWIDTIESFPSQLSGEVNGLTDQELSWRYRPDGWMIRQVVHHCADSHMNAFVRFKLTLTEDNPEVKPYMEHLWAQFDDTTVAPIDWSLEILSGLHKRWVMTLKNLTSDDLFRTYLHSEYQRTFELRQVIALYAWHCRHHLAHVRHAKEAAGKYD